MKLSQLASSSTGSLELLHPKSKEPLGVVIECFTPDSNEWRKFEREVSGPNTKPQSLILEKGVNRIELDPDTVVKRRKLLAKSVTAIVGLEDWTFSPANVEKLFADPAFSWMLEQLGEYLDDRANFFGIPAKPAKSGQKPLAG